MAAAKEETPEQIAERLLALTIGKVAPAVYRELVADTVAALRNEREARDERAVRIIDEHRAMDVCNDNCWTTIKAAIRGRTE